MLEGELCKVRLAAFVCREALMTCYSFLDIFVLAYCYSLFILQSIQTCQKEKYFHETEHDEQDKYVWMTNQDINNLNESYYILEKHK